MRAARVSVGVDAVAVSRVADAAERDGEEFTKNQIAAVRALVANRSVIGARRLRASVGRSSLSA